MKIDFISKLNKVQELYPIVPIVEEGGGELLAPYAVNINENDQILDNEGNIGDMTTPLVLACDTKKAKIMYQYLEPFDGDVWHEYTGPFVPNYSHVSLDWPEYDNAQFNLKSVRGTEESEVVFFRVKIID